MSRYIRPKPLAWFFFLSAFITTVGLGTWQVQRLHWKQGLIHEIESAKHNAPLIAPDLPEEMRLLKNKNFWPVKLHGTWLHEIEYHLAPRYYKSRLGYHIVTPLLLENGRVVLVNRGWVQAAKKAIETRPETIVAGSATVTGILRVGSERNPFTPQNQPEKNIWFGRDVKAMADFYGVKEVVPAMVDATGPQKVDKLPIPSDGNITVYNQHLSYIITWYLIALGILVIFILSHRKKK